MDDRGGAVRPVMGGEGRSRLPELLDRQEDAKGRLGPGDPVELLLLGSGVRPAVRVRMIVWETSGAVSSVLSVAAAAWKELTPGQTS